MTRVFLSLLLVINLTACRNTISPSTDPLENRYFRIYNDIYNQWGLAPTDSTLQRLDAYLKEFPENADAQMMRGNLAYAKADYENAIHYYRIALSVQPKRAVYYAALGSIFTILNQTDSAEKYLAKAIALHDSSAYTYMNSSLLYLKKQDREKSVVFANTAYAKGNTSPVICSGLSFIFKQWKEETKSRELFERAVALGLKDTLAFNQVLDNKLKPEDYYRKNYIR